MSPETPGTRDLLRRLIGRDAARSDPPDRAVAAAHDACERVHRELGRWLGVQGCHALFTRALAQARVAHPVLGGLRLRAGSEPALDGVCEIVAAHDAVAAAAALEALLAALLALLGRLVGDDMATRLVAGSLPEPAPEAGAGDDESLDERSMTP